QFATLSPIPQFRAWVKANPAELAAAFTEADLKKLTTLGIEGPDTEGFRDMLEKSLWGEDQALSQHLKAPLTRLAARYLSTARRGDQPFDPVARFHLGNGARIERVHWMADISPKGMEQSFGLMVNYLYDPDAIEHNVENYVRKGEVAMSGSIKRMLKS
ncbi:MAG: malonyl-CoA decarboxylase family protein, partial [Bacteroidales bacterium]|nr:malonyl-CoA decarboxylase family protein [Bacteroidales bacterium]